MNFTRPTKTFFRKIFLGKCQGASQYRKSCASWSQSLSQIGFDDLQTIKDLGFWGFPAVRTHPVSLPEIFRGALKLDIKMVFFRMGYHFQELNAKITWYRIRIFERNIKSLWMNPKVQFLRTSSDKCSGTYHFYIYSNSTAN